MSCTAEMYCTSKGLKRVFFRIIIFIEYIAYLCFKLMFSLNEQEEIANDVMMFLMSLK